MPDRSDLTRPPAACGGSRWNAVHFLHIPKTAGTSVHRFLRLTFPAGAVCPARTWEDFETEDFGDLHQFQVFSGHWADCLDSYLGHDLTTITLLRDPVEQAISHYAHVRRDPAQPQHALANRLTLAEFCHHDETRRLIENCQCAHLAARVDPANRDGVARGVGSTDGLRAAFERALLDNRSGAAALRRARGRLERCVAVGVTERLTDTLALFADRLGRGWDGPTPYENPSYNRPPTVDGRTADLIREVANLDFHLYREARAMLEAGVAEAQKARATKPGRAAPAPRRTEPGTKADGHKRVLGPIAAQLSLSPEKRFRLKLGLSALIARAPRVAREAAAWLYVGYRLSVDQRISWRVRLPIAMGTGYSAGPINLIPDQVPAFGHVDELLALTAGMLWSRALMDNRVLTEIRLAAISRFHLPRSLAGTQEGRP